MPRKIERDMHESNPKKPPKEQDEAFAKQKQGVMGIRKPGGDKETVPEKQSKKAKGR
jgi:hypothetical protein